MQVNYYLYVCSSTIYQGIGIIIAVLYKLILHVIGLLVLAWQTRKVEIDVLNDYKYTVATVICSSILMAIFSTMFSIPSFYLLPIAAVAAWAALAFCFTLIHIGLTFVPKVSLHAPLMHNIANTHL